MTNSVLNFLLEYIQQAYKDNIYALKVKNKRNDKEISIFYYSFNCTSDNLSICVIFEYLTQANVKGYITRGKFPKIYNI